LTAAGRHADALTVGAAAAAARDDAETVVARLERLLDLAPPCHLGWSLPIEPALSGLSGHPGLAAVLARLAERAA
jgi:hypothetical protein